ncbi:ubiquitin-like domain-containing protein [Streptomyces sp. NPDC057382]|uniref:ubiquitin-like domain-containing protein n=1 Tax=unclassified Streptomyces TaxID=2593676 RepID=UPI003629E896
MSSPQYETYETYGPAYAEAAYGGFAVPPADLHSAETLAHGTPAPGAYADPYRPTHADTHRPAYADPYRPAYADPYRPAYEGPTLPGLPRQGAPAGDPAPAYAEHDQPDGQAAVRAGSRAASRTGSHRRSPRRRRTPLVERPDSSVLRLLPQALVVAFLAGGTTAFVAEDKAIELTVDGRERTLHTFADDVTELLAEEGVELGAHDVVTPGRGAGLGHGDEVSVLSARPLRLTLDGHRREVWTTARTVAGALRQLGVRQEGAYVSTSRSRPIGREGLALDIRTERTVTIMADGRARTVRTNAATVREAVEQAGITLRGQDTTSVAPASFPRDGQTVTVLRITGGREIREEAIPFQVRRTDDPTLFRGTEVVESAGEPGLRRITYAVRTVNGVRQRPRLLTTEVVRPPRAQEVKVGTKPRPESVRGADHLNWQGLAACESGGRPDAVDPSGTYGGLYQFDTDTWHKLGGRGRPQDAPAAEQTYRAKKLYVRRGASPWPHCGGRLHG